MPAGDDRLDHRRHGALHSLRLRAAAGVHALSKHIDSLAASGAILASVWTDADMPVIDCLGDEFLAAVQTGQTVRVLDGGIVEVA